jgi:trimeric autotransporter adhesin
MPKLKVFLTLQILLSCGISQSAELTENSIINTFAGAAHTFSGDGQPALTAALSGFQQLHTDNAGNIIFADTGNQVVSRLNSDGTLTVLAGNGLLGFSGEGGPARSASLSFPSDVVMDKAGNLYIYDSSNFRIRIVTPAGIISTYAGTGVEGYSGDGGPALQAQIQLEGKMAIDAAGTLYFTDGVDAVIRRITPDGFISTYAGNGQLATSPNSGNNGPAIQASLGLAAGALAIDSAGNLYVAEDYTDQIRKIAPNDIITTVAGSGTAGFMDGPAASAQFDEPTGLAFDGNGNLFVADVDNGLIRKVSPVGIVSTVAGTPIFGFSGDGGPALAATFRFAEGVAIGGDGNLYIEDNGNFRIRAVYSDGTIRTVAGNGQFESTPDGTPAANASLLGPNFLSFDPSGRLLIADPGDFTVKRINTDGKIQTIAGFGVQGVGLGEGPVYQFAYGGPATETLLGTPRQAVADGQGNIYVSDDYASVVYLITPDGNLNLFAGQVGVYQFGGDNVPATSSSFVQPQGLALDGSGNLYISDPGDNRIRMVSAATGIITTFAGNGTAGYSGDGGLANQAMLYYPQGIAFDPKGDLIIADRGNDRLRMVAPTGAITTIAGNGTSASTGNGGPASAASLKDPYVVAADSGGNIYLIESTAETVRGISPSGIISLVAGNGQIGFGGDGGPALQASFSQADGLAVDSSGNLYIADFNNNRVREVLSTAATAAAVPASLSFLGTSGGVSTSPQAIALTSNLAGLQLVATTDSPWIQVPPTISYAKGSFSVSADPSALLPGTYQGNVFLTSPGNNTVLCDVPVTFLVNSAVDPLLSTDTTQLTYSLIGGTTQSQSVQVQNLGSGQINFFVTFSGAASPGLTASLSQGTTQPNLPATVSITADPSKLPIGTTTASLLILGTDFQSVTIPITITVSPTPQQMALSQGGVTFVAVQGGGVTLPQSFDVLNTGAGTFSWTAQASTISGGSWLSISPATGNSSATNFGSVVVSANPVGLAPGVYYGLVVVSSAGTINSPQQFEVVLSVLAPNQTVGATAAPSGLIFTAPAGGDSPSSQTFVITNPSTSVASLAVNATTTSGGDWLAVAPDNGTISPGASQIITVQPNIGSLAPGVYQASITSQAGGTALTVNVVFVVVPSVITVSGSSSRPHAVAASCTPTKLYPLFTSLTQGFVIPASWPLPIQVQAVDDCGNPMTSGQVATDFSNGDPRLSLVSLQNGLWQGIWLGHNLSANQIVITANANVASPALHGSVVFTGQLAANPNVPSVNSGGVTSGAEASGQVVIAPGDLITISGQYFGAAPASASQLPLSTDLASTQVFFAGGLLPLIYSSSGKILAMVPYNLAPNAHYELIVSRGGTISGPVSVTVGSAQPDILQISAANSPAAAKNLWSLLTAGTSFTPASAAPATALKPGENLVIYCTGLGAINTPLAPGAPPPSTPISTVNAVSVSIGGTSVPVTFAGLVPGYPGIYQVTLTVPSDAPTGENIPVTISVAGETSPAVKVSVQ